MFPFGCSAVIPFLDHRMAGDAVAVAQDSSSSDSVQPQAGIARSSAAQQRLLPLAALIRIPAVGRRSVIHSDKNAVNGPRTMSGKTSSNLT